jgi:hypothetical protein
MTRRDSDHPMDDGQSRPTWLTEPCPAWCTRVHLEADHPEDRYHQSTATFIPAIVGVRDTVPVTASLEELDLTVWIGRYVGDIVEWAVVEPVEQRQPRLILSVESARALTRGLAEQLDQHGVG